VLCSVIGCLRIGWVYLAMDSGVLMYWVAMFESGVVYSGVATVVRVGAGR
jgi:hypothetical protein